MSNNPKHVAGTADEIRVLIEERIEAMRDNHDACRGALENLLSAINAGWHVGLGESCDCCGRLVSSEAITFIIGGSCGDTSACPNCVETPHG